MDLHSPARSYLEAGGYEVRRESSGFLDLVHPGATRGRPVRSSVVGGCGTAAADLGRANVAAALWALAPRLPDL
jgi:hypothetical protein